MKNTMSICIVIGVVLSLWLGCSEDTGTGPAQTNPNHRPAISLQSDTFATVGDTLRLVFAASDQDGDSMHFNLTTYCSWSEIQDGHCPRAGVGLHDGKFWFWPRAEDVPTRQFKVVVDDGRGGVDSTKFNVVVSSGL
jgi:hypothetical protein